MKSVLVKKTHSSEEVKKAKHLYFLKSNFENQEKELRNYFINSEGWSQNEREYTDKEHELEQICDTITFLENEIPPYESDNKLYITSYNHEHIIFEIDDVFEDLDIFDIGAFKKTHPEVIKYIKDQSYVDYISLNKELLSIYDLNVAKECYLHHRDNLKIEDTQEIKYSFTILDKEYEDRRYYNQYKVTLATDNNMTIDLYIYHGWYARVTKELRNIVEPDSLDFYSIETLIPHYLQVIDNKYNLTKMIRNILTTATEGKQYKLAFKNKRICNV